MLELLQSLWNLVWGVVLSVWDLAWVLLDGVWDLLMVLHKLKSRCKTCLSVPKRGCLQRWRVTWHGEREQRENRHGCANVQCWFCSWCCVCCEFTESTASFRNFCVNGVGVHVQTKSDRLSTRR